LTKGKLVYFSFHKVFHFILQYITVLRTMLNNHDTFSKTYLVKSFLHYYNLKRQGRNTTADLWWDIFSNNYNILLMEKIGFK